LNPEYAATYADLYRRHWWWRAREVLLVREIGRHQPLAGWGDILDVGCGNGLFFDQLVRFGEVWGVESDESLVPADSPHRDRIYVGAFDASFDPNRQFGLVLMLDVLEHIRDPLGALRQVRRLLRPDGRVLITVPAFPLLWTHHDDLNHHIVRYRRGSLAGVLGPAGLKMVSSHYCFHWLVPVKLAVRVFERLGGKDGALKVPAPWVNRFFFAVTRIEQAALGRLDVPFGTSLLAWCAVA
jgi:SAM-dependent methyltransferase